MKEKMFNLNSCCSGTPFQMSEFICCGRKTATMVFAYFKTQIPPTAGEQAAESTELHQSIPTEWRSRNNCCEEPLPNTRGAGMSSIMNGDFQAYQFLALVSLHPSGTNWIVGNACRDSGGSQPWIPGECRERSSSWCHSLP